MPSYLNSIMHLNVNGLQSRLPELLPAIEHCAAVSLQDTRISDLSYYPLHFPNYVTYGIPMSPGCPGIALLVHHTVQHHFVSSSSSRGHSSVTVEIDDRRIGPAFSLSSYYAPPLRHHGPLDVDLLRRVLSPLRALLLGDLNARHPRLGAGTANLNGQLLVRYLDDHDVSILNDFHVPTFCHSAHVFTACLDYAVSTLAAQSIFRATVNGEDLGSDHTPLILYIRRLTLPSVRHRPRWKFHRATNFDAYQAALHSAITQSALHPYCSAVTPAQLDATCSHLTELVTSVATDVLPKVRPSNPERPRLPLGVLNLIQTRRRLRREYLRLPSPALKHEINRLNKSIHREIRASRQQIAHARVSDIAQGPRHPLFWSHVKRHFHGTHPQTSVTPLRDPAAPRRPLPLDEALTLLTCHFRNILGNPIPDSLSPSLSESPAVTVSGPASETAFTLPPADPFLIKVLLRRTRPNRSTGPDTLPYELWRYGPPLLFDILAAFFDDITRLGHVPASLKCSHLAVIPKPDRDLSTPANYRPITLLNTLLKVYEAYVNFHLMSYLQRHSFLPPHMFAFRPGLSAHSPMVHLTEAAIHRFNVGEVTAVVSLDLAKAFDCVNFTDLLVALFRVTANTQFCSLIYSLYGQRSTSVKYLHHFGSSFVPGRGVPQGSSLAPTLFNVLMSSLLPPDNPAVRLYIYADDITVTSYGSTPTLAWSTLQPYLNTVTDWLSHHHLQVQPTKTQLIFLTRSNQRVPLPSCTLLGHAITPSASIRVLGIRIDRRLTFTPHIRDLQRKLEPVIQLLRTLLQENPTVPRYVGLMLLKTLVWPVMTYGLPILLKASSSNWRTLNALHTRAIRAATRSPKRTPLATLYLRARRGTARSEYLTAATTYLLRLADDGDRPLLAHLQYERQDLRLARTLTPLQTVFASLLPSQQLYVSQCMSNLRLHPP